MWEIPDLLSAMPQEVKLPCNASRERQRQASGLAAIETFFLDSRGENIMLHRAACFPRCYCHLCQVFCFLGNFATCTCAKQRSGMDLRAWFCRANAITISVYAYYLFVWLCLSDRVSVDQMTLSAQCQLAYPGPVNGQCQIRDITVQIGVT